MAEQSEGTSILVWIIGAVVIVALLLGALQILDWIFSLPLLVLALVALGGYLWYRNRQKKAM